MFNVRFCIVIIDTWRLNLVLAILGQAWAESSLRHVDSFFVRKRYMHLSSLRNRFLGAELLYKRLGLVCHLHFSGSTTHEPNPTKFWTIIFLLYENTGPSLHYLAVLDLFFFIFIINLVNDKLIKIGTYIVKQCFGSVSFWYGSLSENNRSGSSFFIFILFFIKNIYLQKIICFVICVR